MVVLSSDVLRGIFATRKEFRLSKNLRLVVMKSIAKQHSFIKIQQNIIAVEA